MVGPKKQAFCPRINMLKGNFDSICFEPLMIFRSWSTKSWLSWFSMWNIWNTVWIRCSGNCLHLLGIWNFFGFFRFFPLKLVYFWTESRKNRYGCFFHSICATELKFSTKNSVRTRQSTLKLWFLLSTENHKWFKVVGVKISFEHVDSLAKSSFFRTHHL